MPTDLLLTLHVAAGVVAVIGMGTALVTVKGSRRHRFGGRVYALAMGVSLAFALALAVRGADVFIGLVALFSAYFVYTGWRLAAIRDRRFLLADRVALGLLALASVAMYGFAIVMQREREGLFPVLVVFGTFALVLVWADWRRRSGWPTGVDGVALHLLRMGGASIATLTAVFVVNVRTEPEFVAWLVPSAVLIPSFVVLSRRLKRPAAHRPTPRPQRPSSRNRR